MSHALVRPKRRFRSQTVGVIVLTALLAVCGATLAAVAVSLSSTVPSISSTIRR